MELTGRRGCGPIRGGASQGEGPRGGWPAIPPLIRVGEANQGQPAGGAVRGWPQTPWGGRGPSEGASSGEGPWELGRPAPLP